MSDYHIEITEKIEDKLCKALNMAPCQCTYELSVDILALVVDELSEITAKELMKTLLDGSDKMKEEINGRN